MIFRRSILSIAVGLLLSASTGFAQEDAIRDMQVGMQGLKQAGEDPAMLAQLMQDMQVSLVLLGGLVLASSVRRDLSLMLVNHMVTRACVLTLFFVSTEP